LCLGVLVVQPARAQWTNQFKFIDPSGILLTNRTVLFTPRSAPQTNGVYTISADRLRFVTDTNGSNQIRLYQGSYDVRIMATGGTGETLFTINVPTGTGLTNGLNLISPIIDPSAAVGYTRAQSDNRYVMTTNGFSTNQVATNGTFSGTFIGNAAAKPTPTPAPSSDPAPSPPTTSAASSHHGPLTIPAPSAAAEAAAAPPSPTPSAKSPATASSSPSSPPT
jgi:hypothetical protein